MSKRTLPLGVFESWEQKTPSASISGVKQGRQVDCVALVHCDSPERRWEPLDTVESCTDLKNVACFAVAVRSLSAIPRVLAVQGSIPSDACIGFDCRPQTVPTKFDLEGDIPRCKNPLEDPIYVELHAPISCNGSVPEGEIQIVAQIDIVRGQHDELVYEAKVNLK